MVDRFFTHRGIRLHVVDHGGGGPPVVLLHGGSAHARWWDFVVPHLGAVHAYALDLRGHGDSGWVKDGAYRIADYASDVACLVERLRLERPALVGHSLGAFVALRYAVDHPQAPSALVMVDGRASFGASGSRYLRLLGMLSPAGYDTLEEAVQAFCTLPKETVAAPEVIAHVARHGFRQHAGRWTAKFDRATLGAHEPFDLRDRLGSLGFPVLFVRGEHSTVIRRARLDELAAACRRGSVVELCGCHHHLPIDRPDRLGGEIRAFLRGIAGAR
ncbi:MAG: alpha/beta hydrolase [Deltaproteobacteria bacterium]|nr:alpha/beta hydrolase [Deltaproteobacteria bacterium]